MSGYPCAGKTFRSEQLLRSFNARIEGSDNPRIARLKVHLVNDESLGLNRSVYGSVRPEKDARASEMSAVKRFLGRDDVVIADGLNYIKGYRYQLHCEAKALETPSCVVHIGTPGEVCRENHKRLASGRQEGSTYSDEDFENLLWRYEEPNGMVRWDSPLFTVLLDDKEPPFDEIWDALIGDPNNPRVIRPNAATVLKPASQSDYLYELDKTTSDIVAAITGWQRDHAGEEGGEVRIEAVDDAVTLPTTAVGLAQLQRIRRQFIALNRQHNLEKSRIKALFVNYLNDSFKG